ncbi:MAG: TatD family hydrolase [Candidatus Pacebacteria bacterium]|nr:TatD family hydrolase [Candidatus Paceibacterota bacterium]
MLIDTHAHLNFVSYDEDRDGVIKKSLENDIWMINVGTNYLTSKKAVEIANKNEEGVFASVGLHPINLETGLIKIYRDKNEINDDFSFEKEFDYQKYGELILKSQKKVVAVGEIGFDYWSKPKTKKKMNEFREQQIKLFRKEVSLAREFELPLILHCRLGYEDLIEELSRIKHKFGGVLHCFCGNWKEAEAFLEMGYYIGFNGIIFKLKLDDIIKKTPLERMLVETDCPFLTPPKIKKERNEPVNIKYIVEKIAKVKNVKNAEIERITTENANKLFNLL